MERLPGSGKTSSLGFSFHSPSRQGLLKSWRIPNLLLRPGRVVVGAIFFFSIPIALSTSAWGASSPTASRPSQLSTIRLIERGGAPQLALAWLLREAPQNVRDPRWTLWARERIRLEEKTGQWSDLVRFVTRLPDGLPAEFVDWAELAEAHALIALGDFRSARALIRSWIWMGQRIPSASRLRRARRLLIDSYVNGGDLADAETALQLYRDDYPRHSAPLFAKEARLLIESGKAHAALQMLKADPAPEAQILTLRALLESGLDSPRSVAAKALRLARSPLTPQLEIEADQIAWGADQSQGHYAAALQVLIRMLRVANQPKTRVHLSRRFSADLWQTLVKRGNALANQSGLVEGLTNPWLGLARKEQAQGHVDAAWAVLCAVIQGSFRTADQNRAADQLARMASTRPWGNDLLLFLFLDPTLFSHPGRLPTDLRRRLLPPVLAAGHYRLAARLIHGLTIAPDGMPTGEWPLVRFRTELYGGQLKRALRLLKRQIGRCAPCPSGQRWLVQAFHLERLGHNAAALSLLHALYRTSHDTKAKREMLYWMADAEGRLGHWRQAARDALLSAIRPDPFNMDPWAQSARFKAAQALTQAGLLRDALDQYHALFNATTRPTEKAIIYNKIRKLEIKLNLKSHARSGPG